MAVVMIEIQDRDILWRHVRPLIEDIWPGYTYNDSFEKGLAMTNRVFEVLITFRRDKVAYHGYISRMFNRIFPKDDDRKNQHIVWRDGDERANPKTYKYTLLIFGDKTSAYLSQSAVRFIAEKYANENPEESYEDTYFEGIAIFAQNWPEDPKDIYMNASNDLEIKETECLGRKCRGKVGLICVDFEEDDSLKNLNVKLEDTLVWNDVPNKVNKEDNREAKLKLVRALQGSVDFKKKEYRSPFECTSVDLFGPLSVKVSRNKSVKGQEKDCHQESSFQRSREIKMIAFVRLETNKNSLDKHRAMKGLNQPVGTGKVEFNVKGDPSKL
ncbi:unnamed protein product [Lepeophtheirus salmonis]|uniref:(salmon louse) hypothetical protein n=1 Tax=Lepeophtheirus salmonis TaxID=72036 RepID=A0A7R8CS60_LEPSM|nr:unnamed protein product [Lepeophtheirus salmonis]CAF2913857.1 unnamed protein product [Lepeophtheirus salmonis]